jgi:hypothetical protein
VGTFLNTATNQCEISCSAGSGRRLEALDADVESGSPARSATKEIVLGFLSKRPELAGVTNKEAMEDLVSWLHEQDFGQPALA